MPSSILQARRERIRTIRRRVVGGAAGLFLATTGGLLVQLSSGNDPALASTNATATRTAASSAPTAASSPSSDSTSSAGSSQSTGSTSSSGASRSSGSSSVTHSVTPVTTSQS